MIDFLSEKNELLLSGSLPIEELENLWKELDRHKDQSSLLIRFEEVKDIHFAVIQLLLSFQKMMKDRISFQINDEKVFQIIKMLGLKNIFIKDMI